MQIAERPPPLCGATRRFQPKEACRERKVQDTSVFRTKRSVTSTNKSPLYFDAFVLTLYGQIVNCFPYKNGKHLYLLSIMHFVIISVLCSVTVAVIIKLARMRGINHRQLIVWNYPVALLLTYILLPPDLSSVRSISLPWALYLPLGFMLPAIFVCIALSVQHSGIVKTEVAQRLSLFIPLLAAFSIFDESIAATKMAGIGVGLLAIVFSIGWNRHGHLAKSHHWAYPLCVFFGIGVIDVFFKQVALTQEVDYMTSLWIIFLLAFIVALGFLTYWLLVKKEAFDLRSLFAGLILGIFNFSNILFYMKAHRALPENPSIVFTGMNIGVITIGAIIGVYLFGEKLSRLNKIGIALALLSVLLIAYL